MRSVILPRPEAMIARFPLAASEVFALGVACAEVPMPSRLTDKPAMMTPRWAVWKFNSSLMIG
ncbi:hypothetical protein KJK32_13870 [Streptomyces sp. JCM17656]|nr:hypothetical protein KJK32_13870 [Streptomyces sp. JCM17656]